MNIFLIAIAILCVGVVSSATTIPQETEPSSDIEGTMNFKVKNNPDGTVELDINGWGEAIDAIVGGNDMYVKLHVDEDYEYDEDGDVLGMIRGELTTEEEEEEEKISVSRELARNRAYRNTFYRRGGKSSKSKYYMGGKKTYSSKSSKSKSSKSKSSKGSGQKKKKGRNRKNRKRRYPWD